MPTAHEFTFEEFFASRYPGAVHGVFLIVGNWEVAREVAQEAFVQAFVHWPRVSEFDHPGAWVRQVAFRLALRAQRRERREHSKLAVEPSLPVEPDLDLIAAIQQLSPAQRAAIALFYLDDASVTEVAGVLGCSESTARVHLHRGRRRLADLLREEVTDAER